MAMARFNRPSLMIYGGTIMASYSKLLRTPINISTCYEAHGAWSYDALKQPNDGGDTSATKDEILSDIEHNACPGAGACGGMYTANTMAAAIETMGLSLPGSSSTPAISPSKMRECAKAAEAIKTCMERNIRPRDLLTKSSFENALVITMALGGSTSEFHSKLIYTPLTLFTDAVLHLLAMASAADVDLNLDDFQRVSDRIPYIANLAPSGRYFMSDLHEIGGVPAVQKLLIHAGLLDGSLLTVTGKTLAENVASFPSLPQDQTMIQPIDKPLKSSGHITILRGNLAPGGAVAKLTGKEGLSFTGRAMVFNKEIELNNALNAGLIPHSPSLVIVVRYEGPAGGPGMPEQLKASAAIKGAGLTNIALITDGRYSGASHGFIVGHIVPEAAVGGPIALVKTGDIITIDAKRRIIEVNISDEEMALRREKWTQPSSLVTRGVIAKYARLVGDASHGAVTDLF